MHSDIEKLINIAREGGELTEKQKEIILRKAEELGEDVDETEMILESIFYSSKKLESSIGGKKRKCPHCGAIISETVLCCPECGFTFQKENIASLDARKEIEKLQKKLDEASKPQGMLGNFLGGDTPDTIHRKEMVINTFSMPVTKEGLIQFLEFTYANYISYSGNNSLDYYAKRMKKAWYGKAVQAYNSLARMNDPGIASILEQYPSLKNSQVSVDKGVEKKKGNKWFKRLVWLLVLGFILIYSVKINSDNQKVKDKIEECINNNDYQGARTAAQKFSGEAQELIDRISLQEVSYLISIGDLEQARVVSYTIENAEKRNVAHEAIDQANMNNIEADNKRKIHTNNLTHEDQIESQTDESTRSNLRDNSDNSGAVIETETSEKVGKAIMPGQKTEKTSLGDASIQIPNWVKEGEEFQVVYVYKGAVSNFEASIPEGFLLLWGPQKGTSTSIANGVKETETSFTYVIKAHKKGNYSFSGKAESQGKPIQWPKANIMVINE